MSPITIDSKINIRYFLNCRIKYGTMLPNIQNKCVNKTRLIGRKGGKMRTSQVENKFFHPVHRVAIQLLRKSLSLNDLCLSANRSHFEMFRQTLVTHFQAWVYNCHISVFTLSHPVTFPSHLFLFGCHKSLILGYRKSP